MLLALREAVAAANGASLDLDDLARLVDADREVVHAALVHAVEQGWLTGIEVASLPAGCGTSGCTPEPTRSACRRCPLAR